MTFFLLWLVACEPVATPRGGHDTDPSGGGGGGNDTARYHPVGFEAAEVHGPELTLFFQDCRECHGANLDGGTAEVSCDSCHIEGWRTDCTYCHGGDEDTTGAPGRDIDGSSTSLSFPAHHAHLDGDDHLALDCEICHVVPDRALSPGHLLDDTPASAEVTFSGRAASVQYDGDGCANVACHGNGKAGSTGSALVDDDPFTCQGCHPTSGLSGRHNHDHDRFDCEECHADASGSSHIDIPAKHDDGVTQFDNPSTSLSVSGSVGSYSCTGFCHNGGHFFASW